MAAAPVPASSVIPTGETLSQQTARTFCEVLDQRPCFHALSMIASLASIPLINQMGLDGSWVKLVGQGIQNHTLLGRIPASFVAGYTILGALKIWARTLEAPTADRAKHAANLEILEKLANTILKCELHAGAGDFSKVPLLKRFHQIMRAFDEKINPGADEAPVVDNPAPTFSAPFKSMPDSAKPGEPLGQRYAKEFSSLSLKSFWLNMLGLTCTAISYKIIPMMKLDGAWTNALIEKVHKVPGLQKFTGETLINPLKKIATEWHVAQRVGKIAAGYVAVVALKGLLSLMKAPNADKVAKAKAIKTLAQLSYAMHVVETRHKRNELAEEFHGEDLATRIVALPCSKAPLLERFNNITRAYTRAVTQLKPVAKKAKAPVPETVPDVPVATEAGFTSEVELQTCAREWLSKPTETAKEAFLNALSPIKQNQVMRYFLNLQRLNAERIEAERIAAARGTGGTGGS